MRIGIIFFIVLFGLTLKGQEAMEVPSMLLPENLCFNSSESL